MQPGRFETCSQTSPRMPSGPDVLRANGHPDLPDVLVAEAVGSYADTAPIEVAEHLSPYVMAHSSVPVPDLPVVDASGWLDAVVSAPVVDEDLPGDPADALDGADLLDAGPDLGSTQPRSTAADAGPEHEPDSGHEGLDFGHGTPVDSDAASDDGAGHEAFHESGGSAIGGTDVGGTDLGGGDIDGVDSIDVGRLDGGHEPGGFDTLDDPSDDDDAPDDGF